MANFDKFLKVNLFVTFIFMLGFGAIAPISTFLQGDLFSKGTVAVFSMFGVATPFLVPLVKNWKIGTQYKTIVAIDIIYGILILLAAFKLIDLKIFVCIIIGAGALYGIVMGAYRHNFQALATEKYSTSIMKEFNINRDIAVAAGGLFASFVVFVLDRLYVDIIGNFYIISLLFIVGGFIEICIYNKYYKTGHLG